MMATDRSVNAAAEWIECGLPYWAMDEADSFEKRGLNKPGTLIEIASGEQFLIGHINTQRGTCDDCSEFPWPTVVARYKQIITFPEKEIHD